MSFKRKVNTHVFRRLLNEMSSVCWCVDWKQSIFRNSSRFSSYPHS